MGQMMAVEAVVMYRDENGVYHGTQAGAKEANVYKYIVDFVIAKVERTADMDRKDISQFVTQNLKELNELTSKCLKELKE